MSKPHIEHHNGITTISGRINVHKIPTGHRQTCSGAGVHSDRRTKRNRTRSSQRNNAIRDSNGN